MNGKTQNLCEQAIKIVYRAYNHFFCSRYGEVQKYVVYGKGDTLCLDAISEIIYLKDFKEYDPYTIFITEETDEETLNDLPDDSNPNHQPASIISDPIDRSKYLFAYAEALFEMHKEKNQEKNLDLLKCITMNDLFKLYGSIEKWNEMAGAPASITGATSAITLIEKGKVIFTIIANYITGDLFAATDAGIFKINLNNVKEEGEIILKNIFHKDNALVFPGIKTRKKKISFEDFKRFTTFLGKTGYQENFNDSAIFLENEDIKEYLHHKAPGGPARPLYLSDLQDPELPIGFIMYNGEKITEWIHALSFVKYAKNFDGSKALRIFEISIDRPWTKEGILMSTHPAYSIFSKRNGRPFINMSMLNNFHSPSHYRSMLVIAPADNDWIFRKMTEHKYRDISDCL